MSLTHRLTNMLLYPRESSAADWRKLREEIEDFACQLRENGQLTPQLPKLEAWIRWLENPACEDSATLTAYAHAICHISTLRDQSIQVQEAVDMDFPMRYEVLAIDDELDGLKGKLKDECDDRFHFVFESDLERAYEKIKRSRNFDVVLLDI